MRGTSDSPTPASLDPELRAWIETLVQRRVAEDIADLRPEAQARPSSEPGTARGVTLVVFSGELDRLFAALAIATGAVAMGQPTSLFFTFWGLTALRRRRRNTGKGLAERLISVMLPRDIEHTATSRWNMLGASTRFFKHLMRKKNVQSLAEMLDLAREMGVKLVACQMSMDVMGLKRDELLDDVEVGGVATYLGDAVDSNVTLFI